MMQSAPTKRHADRTKQQMRGNMRRRYFIQRSEPIDSRARSRGWAPGIGAVLLASAGCSDDGTDQTQEELTPGYAIWAASQQSYDELIPFPGAPQPQPASFTDQTLRQIMRISAGGDAVRVRFSNLFGSEPLVIDAAGVARSMSGPNTDGSAQAELLFDGNPSVTIAAGSEVWSDFATLAVPPNSDLAVSLYVARETEVHTVHTLARQTAYVAAGNAVSAATLPGAETRDRYYWLSGIEATSSGNHRVLVAFGDSITDGFNSTVDAARRYPNYLSRDLLSDPATSSYSVVNSGISGNRVLNDVVGPSGASRFRRDALGQTGVTDVIILLGINDIGFTALSPDEDVTAEQITAGLGRFVADAKADDVAVYLATLLPFEGAPYYYEAGETKRQAVNDWIRNNPDVDGVIDFDQLMQDPANPSTMLPAYDSGDQLHPNDQGYEVMAGAIDPAMFAR
jgi:lysophospholipase L1-like esterase